MIKILEKKVLVFNMIKADQINMKTKKRKTDIGRLARGNPERIHRLFSQRGILR